MFTGYDIMDPHINPDRSIRAAISDRYGPWGEFLIGLAIYTFWS